MDKFKSVGERIRAFRDQAGISQKDFAKAIGITPPSLSEIESGASKNPAAMTLLLAAKVLGLDPMYLLTGDGVPIRAVQLLAEDEVRLFVLYRELSPVSKNEVDRTVNALHAEEHGAKPSSTRSRSAIRRN